MEKVLKKDMFTFFLKILPIYWMTFLYVYT